MNKNNIYKKIEGLKLKRGLELYEHNKSKITHKINDLYDILEVV